MLAATGLSGQYYNGTGFASLNTSRLDQVVSFNWSNAAPAGTSLTNARPFGVCWSGQVMADYSEHYTFFVTANSGARLWVNDHLLLTSQSPVTPGIEQMGTIVLAAGTPYNIRLEYSSTGSNSSVQLKWASPSTPKQLIPAASFLPFTDAHDRGSMLTEIWPGLSGTNVSALTSCTNYPNKPDYRDSHYYFECLATNCGTNYGEKVSGYLVPALSGSYTFSVAASDAAELWLSTDAAPANKVRLLALTNGVGFRQFTSISAPVTLAAWQKYYVELLHKAGAGGNDHYSVAWQPPGQSGYSVIGADNLALNNASQTNLTLAASYLTNYISQSHPRLLVSPPRFTMLKNALAAGSVPQLNTWWQKFSNAAVALKTTPVCTYDVSSGGDLLTISKTVLTRIYQLSTAYRMSGDTNFAERAWLELQQVCSTNFPDWNPANYLATAEMTHACAIGYDWLYDYLTPARRSSIRNGIQSKGLNQSVTTYQTYRNPGSTGWATTNGSPGWNFVCNGGMVLGALALGPDAGTNLAVNQFILTNALFSVSPKFTIYTVDNGAVNEGPGYSSYNNEYAIRMLSGLNTALGRDFGLAATPGFSEWASFVTGVEDPLNAFYNYADSRDDLLFGTGIPECFWVARRFNRPEVSAYERDNVFFKRWNWASTTAEALDLLLYDARGTDPVWNGTAGTNLVVTGLPPDNYFRGPSGGNLFNATDVITLRTGWQDTNATFVGFKTGAVGDNWHAHLDAGSFVFSALGYRWANDLGKDAYLANYGSPNDIYYRERAEGHNTLVINPDANKDQNIAAKPPILLCASHPDGDDSYVVSDLTSAYDLAKVWRGIRLFQNRKWFLVQDEIQASASAPATNVWWFMHTTTNANPVIQPGGRSVMMTQGGSRLWITNLTGVGTFVITNAAPFSTSPNPAGQDNNTNTPCFLKLAIHLTNVTNTTLSILMVPLTAGQAVPTTNLPSVVALSNWVSLSGSQLPVLTAVSNRTIAAGVTLTVTNVASDPNTPPQPLSFCLSTAPAGATIKATNGVLSWRPSVSQAGLSNQLTIVVSQSGGSYLSATQSFWVAVSALNQPVIRLPAVSGGQFKITVHGDYGPDYSLDVSSNLVNWTTLFTCNSPTPPFLIQAPATNGSPKCFYRVRIGP